MKSYTADEARRRFGEMLKLADRLPVEITRHGRRRRYVLMSAEAFEVYEEGRKAHAEERILATVQSEVGKLLKAEGRGSKRLRVGTALLQRYRDAAGEKP
jgi:prevent-host-death family protein